MNPEENYSKRVPDLFNISPEELTAFIESHFKFVELPVPDSLKKEGFVSASCPFQTRKPSGGPQKEEKSKIEMEESKRRTKCKAIPNKKPLNIFQYGFDTKADEMLNAIIDLPCADDYKVITNSRKAAPKGGPRCRTRSEYIGVTRNGVRWQAMINVGPKKVYIASYNSERDAAIAFDVHCILLHAFTAKVNFDYTKSELIDIFRTYKSNGYIY